MTQLVLLPFLSISIIAVSVTVSGFATTSLSKNHHNHYQTSSSQQSWHSALKFGGRRQQRQNGPEDGYAVKFLPQLLQPLRHNNHNTEISGNQPIYTNTNTTPNSAQRYNSNYAISTTMNRKKRYEMRRKDWIDRSVKYYTTVRRLNTSSSSAFSGDNSSNKKTNITTHGKNEIISVNNQQERQQGKDKAPTTIILTQQAQKSQQQQQQVDLNHVQEKEDDQVILLLEHENHQEFVELATKHYCALRKIKSGEYYHAQRICKLINSYIDCLVDCIIDCSIDCLIFILGLYILVCFICIHLA